MMCAPALSGRLPNEMGGQVVIVNIVFLDSGTLGSSAKLDHLAQFGSLTLYESTNPSEVAERIRDAHVVLTNKVPLNANDLQASASLQLIVVTASVADVIDTGEAKRREIKVRTIQGYATGSVAQLTICLMLNLACRLQYYANYVASGRYSNQRFFAHVGDGFSELAGKRVGVIGLGSIGSRVADISQALGADVVYFSTTGRNNSSRFTRLDLDDLLGTSDVVTIHAPRTSATYNLIDMCALRKMKRDAILLNVGRGGVVNELDLATALSEGIIGGAALDVFETEPLSRTSPLLALVSTGKVILTPHCAWGGDGAQLQLVRMVHEAISSFKFNT